MATRVTEDVCKTQASSSRRYFFVLILPIPFLPLYHGYRVPRAAYFYQWSHARREELILPVWHNIALDAPERNNSPGLAYHPASIVNSSGYSKATSTIDVFLLEPSQKLSGLLHAAQITRATTDTGHHGSGYVPLGNILPVEYGYWAVALHVQRLLHSKRS